MGEQPGRVDTTTPLTFAARWLMRPVSLVAIAVLVVNDHILKAEFGSWWTGKLSDVAGLIFFPALVALVIAAVAPRIRSHTLIRIAVVTTAVGFATVKVTEVGAATASAVLSVVAGPSTVLRDPTDMIALAALPLAAWTAKRVRAGTDSRRDNRWRVAIVMPLAVLASVATGTEPDPSAVALQEHGGAWYLEVARGQSYSTSVQAVRTAAGGLAWNESELGPDALEPTTLSCGEGAQALCARVVPGRMAVEVSHDGGTVWETDWEISDSARDELSRAHGAGRLVTLSVAVVADAAGPMVIAANGRDGLAVRDADGTWERVGFEDVPRVANYSLVALTDLRNPDPSYPIHPVAGWAALGAALALAVVGGTASWIRLRHAGRLAMSAPLLAMAAGTGYWVANQNHALAVSLGDAAALGDEGLARSHLLLWLAAASLVLLVLASLVLGGHHWTVAGPAWGAALTGLGVAAVVGAVVAGSGMWFSVQVVTVAGAAMAASVPWCLALWAAHHKRALQIPATAPVPPPMEGSGAVGGRQR